MAIATPLPALSRLHAVPAYPRRAATAQELTVPDIERLSAQIDRLREVVESGHRDVIDRLGGTAERVVRVETQVVTVVADVALLRPRVERNEQWRWYLSGAMALAYVLLGVLLALRR